MKRSPLLLDILSCSPRGFSRPLSHAEVFQEPLEQRSGAANADVILADDGCSPQRDRSGQVIIVRHPNYVSPGTFAKVEGKLRKATTSSSISGMRWHNPAGHSRTKRHNPSSYALGPTVKDLEHQRREASDQHQAKAIRQLCRQHKIKRPKSAPAPVSDWLPPPPPDRTLIDQFKATRKPGETFQHWQSRQK